MFSTLKSLFKQLLDGQDLSQTSHDDTHLAIACLLSEVANADHEESAIEDRAKLHLLQKLCDIEPGQAEILLATAREKIRLSASLYDFTSQLRTLSQQERFDLIHSMWGIAQADGHIDPLEDAVIRKTAELLYVDHSEFIRAKLKVVESRS